ncbi:MAG: adenylyl-sulfate kinase [Acidimicrobiia bacterium]|nr:adenylyl-sulfate kinase [Acidimicrobiia bacterium]
MTENVTWHPGAVSRSDRTTVTGGRGMTIWLTGLSGSGKSSVAARVERDLFRSGRLAYTLDGDNVRHGLNADLGFSAADRAENVRRVGEVARLMADAGLVVLVPVISPYRADRDAVRAAHAEAGIPFGEVHVATPIEVCEQRDPKGLYAMARAGEITGFTGVDDPYEEPLEPEEVVGRGEPLAESAALVVNLVRRLGQPE